MRAQEFIKEENIGVKANRVGRTSDRPARGHATESRYKVKVTDDTQLDERGKATVKLCKSSRPDSDLGASNLASCKSQGLRRRKGKKSHLIGNDNRVKVDGKKIKGAKYGGPLPDWSE